MKHAITIMGSAAAEGIPSRFCSCDLCAEARKRGGKDLRMTAAYSFNDRVRIDYGPDSYAEEVKLGLNAATLKHLFLPTNTPIISIHSPSRCGSRVSLTILSFR